MADRDISDTTCNVEEAPNASLALDKVTFHPRYPRVADGMVLISSDQVAFCVEDFYLKAYSRVFREMLSLPTKGGPIGLPESSGSIAIVLDKITDNADKTNMSIPDVISAIGLARRLEFTSTGVMLKQALLDNRASKDAPLLLAYACQARPIDRQLARHALSLFKNYMPWNCEVYRQGVSYKKRSSVSPALNNLRPAFLESLGGVGAVAYVQTLNACQETSSGRWETFDWSKVPDTFLGYLERLEE